MMKSRTFSIPASVLACAVIAPHSLAAGLSDNFDDGVLDPLMWSTAVLGSPSVTEAEGAIIVDMPAGSAGSIFYGQCNSVFKLVGDFDVQVDYKLEIWPPNNGVRTGLSFGSEGVGGTVERTCLSSSGGEVYAADFNTGIYYFYTGDTEGTLRLTRQGDVVTALVWTNGAWASVLSQPRTAGPATCSIWVWAHDYTFGHQYARVKFDNFRATDTGRHEDLAPVAQTVSLGRLVSGNLASLAADDNDPEVLCKFLVPNFTSPIVRTDLRFQSTIFAPVQLDLALKAGWLNAGAYVLRMFQYDYVASQYERSLQDTALTGSYATFYGKAVGDLGRFVRASDGTTQARVEVQQTGPTTAFSPCFALEFANQVVAGP